MKQRLITIIMAIAVTLTAYAEAIGTWTSFNTYASISNIQNADKKVFVLSSGNLFAYNKTDNSTVVYDKQSGLNGINIEFIAWNKTVKKLIVIYDDKDIDLIDANDNVTNIADYANKTMTVNKTINGISIVGQYAYISCAFGIIKLDMKNEYIAETYNIDKNVIQTTAVGNYIYALLSDNTIIKGDTRHNLNDREEWSSPSDGTFQYIFNVKGKLIGFNNGKPATLINPETGEQTDTEESLWFATMKQSGDRAIGINANYFYLINGDEPFKRYFLDANIGNIDIENETADAINCWTDGTDNALTGKTAYTDGTSKINITGIKPYGIPIPGTYRMDISKGTLYVTAGMWSYPFGSTAHDGNIAVLKDGEWSLLENTGDILTVTKKYKQTNAVVVDPRNDNHVFVSAYTGLYEFLGGKFIKRYGSADGLTTYDLTTTEYHLIITDIKFDSNGTLWMLNSMVEKKPLAYLDKNGKLGFVESSVFQGVNEYVNDLEGLSFTDNYVWLVNARTNYPALYRYDRTTDKVTSMQTFYNQDGSPLSINTIYSTAVDKYGNLWLATNAGPLYIMPQDRDQMVITQHKVPRNDGTNYADYLLNNITSTVVCVDDANRKWIGTENQGIYVISSDCNTQIHHFTAESSPLLSNLIYDIEIDKLSGKVYITTDKGLCVYQSDITENNTEMTDDNVHAYPNPVTPDYTGDITITGLQAGSYVKILSVSGNLVSEGECAGGSYVWDGRNTDGKRVASGVYMVNVSKPDGSKGVVTKIAIVR